MRTLESDLFTNYPRFFDLQKIFSDIFVDYRFKRVDFLKRNFKRDGNLSQIFNIDILII